MSTTTPKPHKWSDNPECQAWWRDICATIRSGNADEFQEKFSETTALPERHAREVVALACQCALLSSSQNGHLEIFKYVWGHPSSEKSDAANFLLMTVAYNQPDIFFYIIENKKQKGLGRHQCLEHVFSSVIEKGSFAMIKELLPYVRVKNNHSMFLRQAAKKKDWKLFDLLLPKSNFEAALKYVRSSATASREEKEIFEQIGSAHQTKRLLKEWLPSRASLARGKKKM